MSMDMLAHPGRAVSSTHSRQLGSISLNWRTAAYQIAVSVGAVDPPYCRPDLVLPHLRGWICRSLPGIRAVPTVGDYLLQGVRGIGEQVVLSVSPSLLDLPNLLADGNKRVAEAVELLLGFAFGRLNHQGPGNREGDRRWM